jgi:hypothetical protein
VIVFPLIRSVLILKSCIGLDREQVRPFLPGTVPVYGFKEFHSGVPTSSVWGLQISRVSASHKNAYPENATKILTFPQ